MPKVRGSKNKPIIRAQFDGFSEGLDKKEAKCLVLISIAGNKFYEGDFFRVIVKDAIETFKETTFLIVDLPHKFNLFTSGEYSSIEHSAKDAKEMGVHWFCRNESSFTAVFKERKSEIEKELMCKTLEQKLSFIAEEAKSLGSNFNILTWEDWIKCFDADTDIQHSVEKLSENDEFLSIVEKEARTYVNRHKNNGADQAMKLSQEYLKEEAIKIISIGVKQSFDAIAYAGDELATFAITKKLLGVKIPWFHINFFRGAKSNEIKSNAIDLINCNGGLFGSSPVTVMNDSKPCDLDSSESSNQLAYILACQALIRSLKEGGLAPSVVEQFLSTAYNVFIIGNAGDKYPVNPLVMKVEGSRPQPKENKYDTCCRA